MKVAIAYLTKDRVDLTKQTIVPLVESPCDLFWIDGSSSVEALEYFQTWREAYSTESRPNIKGGADAAIVYALTLMLDHPAEYTHVGLHESDVLVHASGLEFALALFDTSTADGLEAGAVSARAYEDRILIQRDNYAVMLNLGAGHVVFTRQAARLILDNYRTGWWPDVRAIFAQLSGIDVGRYAAFRGSAQWLTGDWHFDAVLAQHGLASLALTPCAAEMIGQDPPLEAQGLRLAKDMGNWGSEDGGTFEFYARNTKSIRAGTWRPQAITPVHRASLNGGASLIFPHQLAEPDWGGDWRLKWSQGFGPFSWRAGADGCRLQISVFGPVTFLVSGGERHAQISITDADSGYEISPKVPPAAHGITQLPVPGGCVYREIVLTCGEGAVFYGIQTQEPQPVSHRKFDYSVLPPV